MLRVLPLRRPLRPAVCSAQRLVPVLSPALSPALPRSLPLSTSPACAAKHKQMPPRPPPPPEHEIDEMFVKGTGPGGQKINKTNSAVQLRHIPTGIVVKSQATRSRSENRAIARGLLAARLDELRNPETCRTAALVAAKLKKRANATKKARRKYRKVGEEAEVEEGENDESEKDTAGQADAQAAIQNDKVAERAGAAGEGEADKGPTDRGTDRGADRGTGTLDTHST